MRRGREEMFVEPISHFFNLYYIINTLNLIVYLFLRESHTSLSQEQGWFGMSRETEMCFLFVLLMGKKIKYVLFITQHSLYITSITPINTHLFKHSFLASFLSFLPLYDVALSTEYTQSQLTQHISQ